MWNKIVEGVGIGDIGTAVYYSGTKFVPVISGVSESPVASSKVLYKGSTIEFGDFDFSSYEFSYLFDKGKFADTLKINSLTKASQDLIGHTDVGDLEKIEAVMFPTLSEDQTPSLEFFGTVYIGQTLLYYLKVPAGVTKIELYNKYPERNNAGVDPFLDIDFMSSEPETLPCLCIYLGPEGKIKNNFSSRYVSAADEEAQKQEGEYIGASEFSLLQDEIEKPKIVWFTLSEIPGSGSGINLSFLSWTKSEDPERNKKDTYLRNDADIKYEPVRKIGDGYILDPQSDTLLGNSEVQVSDHPILDRKKKFISNRYNARVVYKRNESVSFHGKTWISLKDGNIGNTPGYSKFWVTENEVLGSYVKYIPTIVNPKSGATVEPEVVSSGTITPNPGWSLPVSARLITATGTANISINQMTGDFYISSSLRRLGRTLIIDMVPNTVTVTFSTIPSDITSPDVSNIHTGQEYTFEFTFSDQDKYVLESVSRGYDLTTETTGFSFKDIPDYDSYQYILGISLRKFDIIARTSSFELSRTVTEVEYGGGCEIEFYSLSGDPAQEILISTGSTSPVQIEPGQTKTISGTSFTLSLVSGVYKLAISNVKSKFNIDIR